MAKQKIVRARELRTKKEKELHALLRDALMKKNRDALSLQVGKLKDTSSMGKSKKLVARLKTVINEMRELKVLSK